MEYEYHEACSILQIPTSSTEDEGRAAYKRLALIYHPDRNVGQEATSTAQFQQVSAAFDAVQRHHNPPPRQTMGGGGGGGFHFAGGGFGGGFPPGFDPFGGYGHSHDHDEDDYDDEDYSEADEDDGPYSRDGGRDFFEFMYQNIFSGGYGSRFDYARFRAQNAAQRGPPESPEERQARLTRDREAAIAVEARRKEEDRRSKVRREQERVAEMEAGAARRDTKLANKKEKAAKEKAQATARTADRMKQSQATRSAVFAAARAGKADAVKKGVWEDNVGAADVERLPGFLLPGEKDQEDQEHESWERAEKENIEAGPTTGAKVDGEAGANKAKKNKKMKGKRAATAAAAANGPTTDGAATNGAPTNSTFKAAPPLKTTDASLSRTNGAPPLETNGVPKAAPPPKPKATPPPPKPKSTPPPPKKRGLDERETLLHIAVKKGDVELAEWLIDHGASPEERDSALFTPFHHALQAGHVPLVTYFLTEHPPLLPAPLDPSAPRDPDSSYPTPPGESLLSLAVSSVSAETVALVLPLSTLDDAWDNWNWIEDLQRGKRRVVEKEKEVWEKVKWAIVGMDGFEAPEGYVKKRRGRA